MQACVESNAIRPHENSTASEGKRSAKTYVLQDQVTTCTDASDDAGNAGTEPASPMPKSVTGQHLRQSLVTTSKSGKPTSPIPINGARQLRRSSLVSTCKIDPVAATGTVVKSSLEAFRSALKATNLPRSELELVASQLSSLFEHNYRIVYDAEHGEGSFSQRFSIDGTCDPDHMSCSLPPVPNTDVRKFTGDGFKIQITAGHRTPSFDQAATSEKKKYSHPRLFIEFESCVAGRSLNKRLLIVKNATFLVHSFLRQQYATRGSCPRGSESTFLHDEVVSFSSEMRRVMICAQRARTRLVRLNNELKNRDDVTYLNNEIDNFMDVVNALFGGITNTDLISEPRSFSVIHVAVIGVLLAPVHTNRIATVICRSGQFISKLLEKIRQTCPIKIEVVDLDAVYSIASSLIVELNPRSLRFLKKVGVELMNAIPSLASIRGRCRSSSDAHSEVHYFNAMLKLAYKTSKVAITSDSRRFTCVSPQMATIRLVSLSSKLIPIVRKYFHDNPVISAQIFLDNADIFFGTTDQRSPDPNGASISMTVMGAVSSPAELGGLLDHLPSRRPRYVCITPGPYYGTAYDQIEGGRRSASHRCKLPPDPSTLAFTEYDYLDPNVLFERIPELGDISSSDAIPAPFTCSRSEKQVLESALDAFDIAGMKRALNAECPLVNGKLELTRHRYREKQENDNPTAKEVNTVTGLPASMLNEMVVTDMSKLVNLLMSLVPFEEKGQEDDKGRPSLVVDDLSVQRINSARVMQLKHVMAGFTDIEAADNAIKLLRRLHTADVDHDRLHQVVQYPSILTQLLIGCIIYLISRSILKKPKK